MRAPPPSAGDPAPRRASRAIPLVPTGPHSPGQLRTYVDELLAAARRAAEAVGPTSHEVIAGGRRFAISVAGDQPLLAALGPALGAGEERPDRALELAVWDVRASGVPVPDPPAPIAAPRSAAAGGARVLAAHQRVSGVVAVVDLDRGVGAVAMRDSGALSSWERASPLRPVLHWGLAEQGVQVVHGGAIVVDGGAVLVVGASGGGKSTTCLAALAAGLGFLGDDYVAVEVTGAGPVVHRLYTSAKIDPDHAQRIAGLAACTTPLVPLEPGEKQALLVAPGRLVQQAPLRVVVVPTAAGVAGREAPVVRAIPAREALRRAAPSTLLQLEGAGSGALAALATAFSLVPCVELALPRDPARIVPALQELMAR